MTDLLHDLGRGLPGTVVYESRLAQDNGDWEKVHRAARTMASQAVSGHHGSAGLFHGAPALAFALHSAGHPAYRSALAALDESLSRTAVTCLSAAHARMDAGRAPRMREYDLISGLTGLGAYFLSRRTHKELLLDVLWYLVRLLEEPVRVGVHELPGWWTSDTPSGAPDRVGPGHGNFGLAHGVAGPIALLALACRDGFTVPGQRQALVNSCRLLEEWAQPVTPGGSAWPETVDLDAWRTGPAPLFREGRPSWCYGTPGIARALQSAALAAELKDTRVRAEELLTACVQDPEQLARLTDLTVCHGWAGLCLAADRAAADSALGSPLRRTLPDLRAALDAHLEDDPLPEGAGILTGADGVRLTIHTLSPPPPVGHGWETCLLLS